MSSSSRRQQEREGDTGVTHEQQQQQQQQPHQATIRSIDKIKDNIHQAIDEARRETPRYSQAITDFRTETIDAAQEIAVNFLDSQKEVINSFQSGWAHMIQRTGDNRTTTDVMGGGTMMVPFFFFSPQEMANIYARTIGAATEAYVASTRITANMMFVGIESIRATTNYVRQNAKEAARVTSNTARAFG